MPGTLIRSSWLDLWFLTAMAALAGVGCLAASMRQHRLRWLTLCVGVFLLFIAGAIALLQRSPG